MIVKIKKTKENAVFPKRMTEGSVGFDVTACSKTYLNEEKTIIQYGIGLAFQYEDNSVSLNLFPRSSIYKTGLVLSNSVGVGDSDFRGEYGLIFYKVIPNMPEYEIGDRIGQIVFTKSEHFELEYVTKLNKTTRTGGMGSTGR